MERIAVIGAGIAGLTAARTLQLASGQRQVSLFEAGSHFGGHANTVDVTLDGVTHGVDTGFLVYNERTYPGLIRLFEELDVPTAKSDMSFSVQALSAGLEWSGSSLASVFAQRSNLLRADFWRMLVDIVRFNRLTTQLALRGDDAAMSQNIEVFLEYHRFSEAFRHWYLMPMVACIWSCPSEQMLRFPIGTLIRFCHNHGLLQVSNRPQWLTVRGGSREYVRRVIAQLPDTRLNTPVLGVQRKPDGVWVHTAQGQEHFDQVVFATHTDQTLRLLGGDASAAERKLLGAIRYQPNRAVLHTDTRLMPSRRSAWAAWNYESSNTEGESGVCLHYWLNQLQPLPWKQAVMVSLNPVREPDAAQVIRSFEYDHPVFDARAVQAQRNMHLIQGHHHAWFCGAWAGHGFHEDGLQSGQAVAKALLSRQEAQPLMPQQPRQAA